MSTSHYNNLWIPKWEDIDKTVPDVGARVLPGRICALVSKQPTSGVLAAERRWLTPDTATVASSGVSVFNPGDVIVCIPDTGAEWKKAPDGRIVRFFGVGWPWWSQVCGKLDEHGFHPAPGWALFDREERRSGMEGPRAVYEPYGTCLESCGEVDMAGQRTDLPDKVWTLRGFEPSLCVGEAPIASWKWLAEL